MRSASSSSSSPFALGLTCGAVLGVGAVAGRKVVGVVRGGRGHPLEHRVLDLAASLLQRKRPLSAISTCLSGFHFYADDLGGQVEATHLCNHRRHDLHQCVIDDSDAPDARLIGIEYIVSAERFATLPEEEKRLWHSHHHEVTSGVLIAPGVPQPAEHAFLRDLATTYGKTFHTWQYDRDPDLPLGPPQLMMAFTADGQERRDLVEDRDGRLGVSSERRRQQRSDITPPEPVPGADSWEGGTAPQLRAEDVPVRRT